MIRETGDTFKVSVEINKDMVKVEDIKLAYLYLIEKVESDSPLSDLRELKVYLNANQLAGLQRPATHKIINGDHHD
jgi:hypothetical protein